MSKLDNILKRRNNNVENYGTFIQKTFEEVLIVAVAYAMCICKQSYFKTTIKSPKC